MAPRKTSNKNAPLSKSRKPSKPVKLARQVKVVIQRKASTPLKGQKAVFTGKIFVLTGDFPNSHSKMDGWITHHGGRVDKEVTQETTHLVCTMDNFKNEVSDVQIARRLGKARCKIVDWEFIEDSILPKPRRISETTYQLENILAGKKRKRAQVMCRKEDAGKDSEGSKEVIEPPCHHVYVDKTGFKYKVVLHRTTQSPGGKELEERLAVCLFESDPLPHTYRVATYCLAKKYKKTDVVAVLYHDQSVGKEFYKAYAEFKSIFEEKTGNNWDQRLDRPKQEKGSYIYTPPKESQ